MLRIRKTGVLLSTRSALIAPHEARMNLICLVAFLAVGSGLPAALARPLTFSCGADNDPYRVASGSGMEVRRFDTPGAAVAAAAEGEGVLLLADGYPANTIALDAALFGEAARKKLRLHVDEILINPEKK